MSRLRHAERPAPGFPAHPWTFLYNEIKADDLTAKAVLNYYDGRPRGSLHQPEL